VFADLPPHHEVLILGAGFSRALSARMPLTDELGNACLALNDLQGAHGVPAEFTGGRFETWLSSIAEPQPYLPEPSNLENQVLFVKFSDAIGKVLGLRMHEVLSEAPPTWHVKFVAAAHVRRATVITFNYDTLVECAIDYRRIWLPGLPEPVAWTEVTGNVPGWPAGATRAGASPVETFRLLKLHGSLNWFWTPGDMTGLSVARRQLPGTFTAPQPYTEDDRCRQLPARVPFVVPPSATKSSYYQNRLVRELWIQAGEALEAASHVSLVGYSLPLTDLTVSNMLNRALGGSEVFVHVVDLDPEPIVVRLGALGVAASSAPGSPSAAEEHVTSYCQAISLRALPMTNSSPAGAVWFAVSIVLVSVSTLSDDWSGAISRLLPAAAAASRIVCSQARATVTVREGSASVTGTVTWTPRSSTRTIVPVTRTMSRRRRPAPSVDVRQVRIRSLRFAGRSPVVHRATRAACAVSHGVRLSFRSLIVARGHAVAT